MVIREATDIATGAAISSVSIRNVLVDGIPEPSENLAYPGWSEGISDNGDSVECRPRCAFGAREGPWKMVVQRSGYLDLSVEFEARYLHERRQSCAVRVWGATELSLAMTRL